LIGKTKEASENIDKALEIDLNHFEALLTKSSGIRARRRK
jgi:hypothetical protein